MSQFMACFVAQQSYRFNASQGTALDPFPDVCHISICVSPPRLLQYTLGPAKTYTWAFLRDPHEDRQLNRVSCNYERAGSCYTALGSPRRAIGSAYVPCGIALTRPF